jgi:uracil-DNA glycosylase
MIIATCPQADGAYETGIPYQNEFAGRWIYSALKVLGCFDSAATDVGMATKLNDVYLTYGVKQPVPKDRPQASENDLYLPFLHRELQVLSNLKCILAFGRMTHTLIQKGLAECDLFDTSGVDFPDYEHGVIHTLGEGLPRIANYHKLSPRNESTQAVSRGGFTRLVMNCLAAS